MRKEKFTIGNYVHVFNRGNRKENIVRSEKDSWRFIQGLRFFNDSHSSQNLLRQITKPSGSLPKPGFDSVFKTGWPPDWPEKDPLVKILCYCLLPNHLHLLLKEIREGGIGKFMHKLGVGYTNYFNIRHEEIERVFQGPYKAKGINEQRYLEYLSVYIQVINTLELFPGGLEEAANHTDEALKFVENYPFSSYQDFIGLRKSVIIDKDIFGEIFSSSNNRDYKKFAREVIKKERGKPIMLMKTVINSSWTVATPQPNLRLETSARVD